jgi:hypothetical protein
MDPARDAPALEADLRAGRGSDGDFPADEIIGMGYFPDELGLAGSPGSTLGGIHRAAE